MGNFLWRAHRRLRCIFLGYVPVFSVALALALGAGSATVARGQSGIASGESGGSLRVVLVPEKNAFILRSQFKPVIDFLARKIGHSMYLEIASDYETAVQAFVDKKADIGFLGANAYLSARERAGVEPLVRPVWPQRRNIYRSYIFVRQEDGINELNAMAGMRLAVVDRMSLAGFLFADCLFENSGIKRIEDYFGKVIWAGSHDTAIWSVVTGEADVGVASSRVYDELLREYPEEMEKMVVLSRSAELPTLCCVVSKDFPEADKERLLFLFGQMDNLEEGREALTALGAESFARAYDAEYNLLRQAVAVGGCRMVSEDGGSPAGSR